MATTASPARRARAQTFAQREAWRRIRVDTSEQLPLVFPHGITTVRGSMDTGDYCLEAAQSLCVVERKSASDLLNCIGGERPRFERMLERCEAFPAPCALVVEDIGWRDLLAGRWPAGVQSQVHPASAVGSLLAWAQRHNVHVLPAGDRATAAALTVGWLRRAYVEATQAP